MKPSELIEERTQKAMVDTNRMRQECGREPLRTVEQYLFTQGEEIVRYLDEQAEIEQRRVHVRNALAMVSQYAHIPSLNEVLEAAGLTYRVEIGTPCEGAWLGIVDEAKREGLF